MRSGCGEGRWGPKTHLVDGGAFTLSHPSNSSHHQTFRCGDKHLLTSLLHDCKLSDKATLADPLQLHIALISSERSSSSDVPSTSVYGTRLARIRSSALSGGFEHLIVVFVLDHPLPMRAGFLRGLGKSFVGSSPNALSKSSARKISRPSLWMLSNSLDLCREVGSCISLTLVWSWRVTCSLEGS